MSGLLASSYTRADISIANAPQLSGITVLVIVLAALMLAWMYRRLQRQEKESAALRKELLRSEQESRMLLESAPFPLLITRLQDGGVEYANNRAAELYGVSAEEMLSYHADSFYANPAEREKLVALVMRDGRVVNFEIDLKNRLGEIHQTLLSCYISALHGKPVLFAAFSDITRQKQIENEITQREVQLRRLLDEAPIPIVISRIHDSQMLYSNRAAGTLLGIAPDNLVNVYAKDFYSNIEDREIFQEKLSRDGHVSGHEVTLKTRDRPKLCALITVGTTRFQHQDALMITLSDISERKRVEDTLRESEERYRFLAENTGDIVWQKDARHYMTYINASDERLRGFPREQVIGHSATQLFTKKYARIVSEHWQQQVELASQGSINRAYTFEAEEVCKDGRTIWVEVCSTPLLNERGEIFSYVGITRNISERKKNEQALQAMNTKLSEQVLQIQSLQAALQEQVVHDALTGLYNRRYLDDAIEREILRATREAHPVSVAILDIDHFKKINDTYGHQAGDAVLRIAGKLLRDHTRASDIPCRMGGEEFLVILPNMGIKDALARADQLRTLFASLEIPFGKNTLKATISIGLASYPAHGRSANELIRQADSALYLAKQSGRNQVAVAKDSSSSP